MARSRSNSSSSSSSSDSSSSKHDKSKLKKQDKDKKKHNKGSDKQHGTATDAHPSLPGMAPSFLGMPLMPTFAQGAQAHAPSFPTIPPTTAPGNNMFQQFPQPSHEQSRSPDQQHIGSPQPQPQQPGAYSQRPPPSGFRLPLSTDSPFPHEAQIGSAPLRDADGVSPVYVGSALFASSVHPCKIAPSLHPTPCRVPYGGGEFEHKGRYDLLPITIDMEWVRTSRGEIPAGRQPVEGGYEENGGKLYHALANVNGVKVPGKCGKHLSGANVAFAGQEIFFSDYEVLCWK